MVDIEVRTTDPATGRDLGVPADLLAAVHDAGNQMRTRFQPLGDIPVRARWQFRPPRVGGWSASLALDCREIVLVTEYSEATLRDPQELRWQLGDQMLDLGFRVASNEFREMRRILAEITDELSVEA